MDTGELSYLLIIFFPADLESFEGRGVSKDRINKKRPRGKVKGTFVMLSSEGFTPLICH